MPTPPGKKNFHTDSDAHSQRYRGRSGDRTLLIAIPLTVLLSCGGGLFLSRRAFNPVRRITDIAEEIGESDLSRRIDIATKDELGKLAAALNRTIGKSLYSSAAVYRRRFS